MSAADERTEGWAHRAVESCLDWTADQHAQVAADLLDGMCNVSMSQDGWDGEPAHRHYEAECDGATDYAPLLAALVHVGLAHYKRTPP